jgi:4-hydroxy-tetrahydrodipicolinate reductase
MARLKVGLFGFGRTGQLVAREILSDPALELAWVVRRSAEQEGTTAGRVLGLEHDEGRLLSLAGFQQALATAPQRWVDVVVDFSGAAGVHAYEALACLGTRVVSAVSRYDEAGLSALKRMSAHAAVLHSPNITVGINFVLVAARAMKRLVPEADVAVLEEHFREKPEISGTAVRLAQALDVPSSGGVHSIRAGGIVGRHEVIFGLPNQTVRLVHESINRAAFGRGAIFAAKWLSGQERGLYTMEDAVRASMTEAFLGSAA